MEGKKILILAHKPPYPKVDGGCIAMAQLLEASIAAGFDVFYFALETKKHPAEKNIIQAKLQYKTVSINTDLKFLAALKNTYSKDSYFLSRFKQQVVAEELLTVLCENKFETVVFESLFTSPYIDLVKANSNAKLVYRSHNIEHQIWETQRREYTKKLYRAYLKRQVNRLKREELEFWNQVDSILSISASDSELISKYTSKKVTTVGLYCNTHYLNEKEDSSEVDFFHIGAMDWEPNQSGVSWLLNNVWSLFTNTQAKAELHIAGRKMPKYIEAIELPNLYNHKEVADAVSFMNSHKVMLVPLFSGSGIRVKIVEGMSLGKCIISTSIGTTGIASTHKKNILIADSAQEFIEQMRYCIKNPKRIKEIGENAREFAKENFAKSKIIQQLQDLL